MSRELYNVLRGTNIKVGVKENVYDKCHPLTHVMMDSYSMPFLREKNYQARRFSNHIQSDSCLNKKMNNILVF